MNTTHSALRSKLLSNRHPELVSGSGLLIASMIICIILPFFSGCVSEEEAEEIEIEERIRETNENRTFMASQNENITITTSIGINTLKTDEHEGNTGDIALLFVERADRALYQAKDRGRNRETTG